jgi:hypothetical protein
MRELSVAEQRYQAVMAVIGDGLTVSQAAVTGGANAVAFMMFSIIQRLTVGVLDLPIAPDGGTDSSGTYSATVSVQQLTAG